MINHQFLHGVRSVADGEHHHRHTQIAIVAGECAVRDGGEDVNLAVHRYYAFAVGLKLLSGVIPHKDQGLECRRLGVVPVEEIEWIYQAAELHLPRCISAELHVVKVQMGGPRSVAH